MVRTKQQNKPNTDPTNKDDDKLPPPSSSRGWSWRDDDDGASSPTKNTSMSRGIAPASFHRYKNNNDKENNIPLSSIINNKDERRRTRDQLSKVLSQACTNAVRRQRRAVTTKQKLQRAAYKQVTSLRTWPLQDMAMKDLKELLLIHFGQVDEKKEDINKEQQQQPSFLTDAEQHGYSSTGGMSSASDEPKRVKKQVSSTQADDDEGSLSPRKSTMRNQFKLEFLREQAIPPANAVHDDENGSSSNKDNRLTISTSSSNNDINFLPALWCMEPRMFAVEKSTTGKRKYLVGHLGRFLDWYWRKCDPKNRHYYELIREKTPCRLYFDLEYSKIANPEITETASEMLLDEFMEELIAEFQSVYGITLDRSGVVDLDSSTDKKFSHHWIVHLPNKELFADAAAAGRFVRILVGRLAEEAATGVLREKRPTLQKYLFINSKPTTATNNSQQEQIISQTQGLTPPNNDDKVPSTPQAEEPQPAAAMSKTCFVDLGVYTRNRLFRLLGSSKFGKPPSAALRIASNNTFLFPNGFSNDRFYIPEVKENLLTKTVEASGDNLTQCGEVSSQLEPDMDKFLSAVDWTAHAEALCETLVVPVNGTKLSFPILSESDETKQGSPDTSESTTQPLSSQTVANHRQVAITSSLSTGTSPFPSVDDFIVNTLGSRGGVQGAIRVWSIDCDTVNNSSSDNGNGGAQHQLPRSITYQMCRNRWCERIGRPHKSNNIMWTVDLKGMSCVQSCHDPECRTMRFRGTPVDLPDGVRADVEDALFEQQLAFMDETTILQKNEHTEEEKSHQTAELDDADFERALLALDISGKKEPIVSTVATTQKSETDQVSASQSADLLPGTMLSDTTLVDAAFSNPELFP